MNPAWQDVMKREEFTTRSEQETFELARNIGRELRGDEVVLLTGELGAGKTVFAKGLASGLGLQDITQVCSPSFTLINLYYGRFLIIHMDLYRLGAKSDILDLGWEDYLGQGVIIVEWAEKMEYDAPAIRVTIQVGLEEERVIRILKPDRE